VSKRSAISLGGPPCFPVGHIIPAHRATSHASQRPANAMMMKQNRVAASFIGLPLHSSRLGVSVVLGADSYQIIHKLHPCREWRIIQRHVAGVDETPRALGNHRRNCAVGKRADFALAHDSVERAVEEFD